MCRAPVQRSTIRTPQRIIEAAKLAADKLGVPYCITVAMAGGDPLALARKDRALIGCIDVAINEAEPLAYSETARQHLANA